MSHTSTSTSEIELVSLSSLIRKPLHLVPSLLEAQSSAEPSARPLLASSSIARIANQSSKTSRVQKGRMGGATIASVSLAVLSYVLASVHLHCCHHGWSTLDSLETTFIFVTLTTRCEIDEFLAIFPTQLPEIHQSQTRAEGADTLFTIANLLITSVFPAKTQALAGGVCNTVAQIGKTVGLATTAGIASNIAAKEAQNGATNKEALLEGYKAAF